ncbi:MAG: hypothetical protein ACUVS6_03650 [Anaerolineae bacterium]
MLVGVAVLAFLAYNFVELTFTREELVARHEYASSRVERMKEQNARLLQELIRDQQGEHLPGRAWEYFGQTLQGARVVMAETQPTASAASAVASTVPREPVWVTLWKHLIQALTELGF